ncbi:immunity 8 family protein [Paraburkholderia antibiotica]|nr:immunity 8 family protein [Paraburkholderia antibiotica]
MKAIVKSMWVNSPTIDLDSYFPDDPENFSLWIELRVGPDDSSGADDYRVLVCTPEWLHQNVKEPRWGRHMLIVEEYDRSAIEASILDYVAKCMGDGWRDIAEKIARNLSWEFEDYRE